MTAAPPPWQTLAMFHLRVFSLVFHCFTDTLTSGLPDLVRALFPPPQFCMHPSASRTRFQMSYDDSVHIMPHYITALAFRAQPQRFCFCFLSADSKNQSVNQTVWQACPEKQLWQAQKRKCLLYESCVLCDLCLFMILAKSDGGEWRLSDALATHGPVLWTLNDEVMDFVVDKVGHILGKVDVSFRRKRDCSKQGVTLLLNWERSTLIDILIYIYIYICSFCYAVVNH